METIDQNYSQPELSVGGIISGAFSLGIKNAPSLIGAAFLWLLTCWIPYLNVGTTIALLTIPAKLSHGKIISPAEIFDAKYRKPMGDFFIMSGLYAAGFQIALVFMVIPGIVLAISWSLAPLLLISQGLTPTQALTASNQKTYGHKWTIFFGNLVLGLVLFALFFVAAFVGSLIPELGVLLSLLLLVVLIPVQLGAQATIYRSLSGDEYE